MLKTGLVLYIKIVVLFFILSAPLLFTKCNNSYKNRYRREVMNIVAFSKMYGYIRFFHPSDESSEINWSNFAVYGISEIKDIQHNESLKQKLLELFVPIAPTCRIYLEGKEKNHLPENKNINHYDHVFLQHRGISLCSLSVPIYKSKRFFKKSKHRLIFPEFPHYGEEISEEIIPGLFCKIPLVLLADNQKTIGNDDKSTFNKLVKKIKNIEEKDDINSNIANVIIVWNIIQHSFPNFDDIDTDWEEELYKTIDVLLNKTRKDDSINILEKMLSNINDGHANVVVKDKMQNRKLFPFLVDFVDNKVVVKSTIDPENFKKGDIVLKINGKSTDSLLYEGEQLISGSSHFKKYCSLLSFGVGDSGTYKVKIMREGKIIEKIAKRKHTPFEFLNTIPYNRKNIEISDEIYYISLREPSIKIIKILDSLPVSKNIIFDFRFGSEIPFKIISHLTDKPVYSPKFCIPKIIYPDHKYVGYDTSSWKLFPKEPKRKGKTVFLINSGNMSAQETFLQIIKQYKLGVLIGQQTAGANGNVNIINLSDYKVYFTGMKVYNPDGSKFNLVGVKPDIFVYPTIEGIKNGKDEVLERAIKYLNE